MIFKEYVPSVSQIQHLPSSSMAGWLPSLQSQPFPAGAGEHVTTGSPDVVGLGAGGGGVEEGGGGGADDEIAGGPEPGTLGSLAAIQLSSAKPHWQPHD